MVDLESRMSGSAFRSSSKRGIRRLPSTASSSSKDRHVEISGKKAPLRRSRSMASLPGNSERGVPEDLRICTNMRDNPLFGCSSSSPSPDIEFRGETTKGDLLDCRRGRSMPRYSNFRSESSYCQSECGRSFSRDGTRRRRLRSLSRSHYGDSKSARWEDKFSSCSLSEAENLSTENYLQSGNISPDLGSGENYETAQFEVHSSASESIIDIQNAVKRRNPSIISLDSTANITAELVNPDGIELISDIRREYAIKLEQSQERLRKLQADLAVEEQQFQELSRILENIVQYPKSFELRESQAKKKASTERIRISKRLAEEAMNYFDECVSLSTFDGSDFSSLEDQHTGSNFGVNPTGNSRFSLNGCSNSSASNYPCRQLKHQEGLNSDVKCFHSIVESECRSCTSKPVDLIHRNVHDDLPELNTPPSRSASFLYASERSGSLGIQEIRNYMKKFEKEKSKCVEKVNGSTSYSAKDHISNSSDEALLFEKVMLRSRIYFGGIVVCQVRTF